MYRAQLHNQSLSVRLWVQPCFTEKGLFSYSGTILVTFVAFYIFFSGNTRCSGAGWSSHTAQIIYQKVQTQPHSTRNVIPGIPAGQKHHTLCSALISGYEFSMASPPSTVWKVLMLCTHKANSRGEKGCPGLVSGQLLCLMLPGHGLDLGKLHSPKQHPDVV